VVQRKSLALAASLAALVTAGLLSRSPDTSAETTPMPESVALAHLVRFAPEEVAFTALVRAAGGDLYADWKEP
jgi:hypothetical protein